MSLESWKEEFYEVEAYAVANEEDRYVSLRAAKHSLKKWIGSRPENLKKHELIRDGVTLVEEGCPDRYFVFGVNSCALCILYDSSCKSCPLALNLQCKDGCGVSPEYAQLGDEGSAVEEMIAALQKTVDSFKES